MSITSQRKSASFLQKGMLARARDRLRFDRVQFGLKRVAHVLLLHICFQL